METDQRVTSRSDIAKRIGAYGCAIAGALLGVALAPLLAVADEPQQNSPLVKTAIFTRIYGRPTIPHIMKFVGSEDATATRRFGGAEERGATSAMVAPAPIKRSSMPVMRTAASTSTTAAPTVAPSAASAPAEPLPAPSNSAAQSPPITLAPGEFLLDEMDPPLGPRTFSYHYPWWYGTSAGAYPPADYAAYRSYYYRYGFPWFGFYGNYFYRPWSYGIGALGWGGFPYGGTPYGSFYGGFPYYGYLAQAGYGGSPYAFATPFYGAGGGLGAPYWGGYGGFGGYGLGGYGFGGYGPGPFPAAASYAGCYYW